MTPAALMAELEGRGAVVVLREDRARCEAPVGALTDELRSAWPGHRAALAALLRLRIAAAHRIVGNHIAPDRELMAIWRAAQAACPGDVVTIEGHAFSKVFDAGAAYLCEEGAEMVVSIASGSPSLEGENSREK